MMLIGLMSARTKLSFNGSVEIGHAFNDLYWSGVGRVNDDGSKTWRRQSFLFSPLAGVHAKLKYRSAFFSVGCQYQQAGRYNKEEWSDFTDQGRIPVTTTSFSHKFEFIKLCFPITIGLWNKRKKNSESLFFGFRPCFYRKAKFTSIEVVKNANIDYHDTLSFDLLTTKALGNTIPKTDFQFFLGFSFPENSAFSVSIILYAGKIYYFDNIRYQYHYMENKYVNLDGVLSVRYTMNHN